ncbi:hypothetical protein MCANUFG1_01298 [Mycoplasmopsis canis UFG1]|uniref:MAG2960 family serine endopeptidase lipoprotein n=1 Tax=Mycoplasmopsis canis TaxID=29555 RepID=UPI00025AF8D0|nr:hypothetical protein [Mycoplasmopsis canis]EIE42036.1 hypothetical protein MCANUFG1_01298 [Mycoplasmopsis canis UFG1]
MKTRKKIFLTINSSVWMTAFFGLISCAKTEITKNDDNKQTKIKNPKPIKEEKKNPDLSFVKNKLNLLSETNPLKRELQKQLNNSEINYEKINSIIDTVNNFLTSLKNDAIKKLNLIKFDSDYDKLNKKLSQENLSEDNINKLIINIKNKIDSKDNDNPKNKETINREKLLNEINDTIENANSLFSYTDNKELVSTKFLLAKKIKNVSEVVQKELDYPHYHISDLSTELVQLKTIISEFKERARLVEEQAIKEQIITNINTKTRSDATNLKHSLGFDLIFDKSSNEFFDANSIITKNPIYIKKVRHFINYLKSANNGNGVDLSSYKTDNEYLRFLKEIGVYGEYGDTPLEKIKYFYNGYDKSAMMKPLFLDNFIDNETQNSITLNSDHIISSKIKGIINKNPFGLLPSNLSQFFYYIDLNTLSQMISINEPILEIKANYDDESGLIELFIKTNSNKYLLKLNQNNSPLKRNADFYQYIYDRSFSLGYSGVKTIENFGVKSYNISTSVSGTAWILDRLITDHDANKDEYEFLVATNMHVVSLTHIFDRSLVFNQYTGYKDKERFIGRLNKNFIFGKKSYEIDENNSLILDYSRYFLKEVDKTQGTLTSNQYLDWLVYTPKFKSNDVKAFRNVKNFMNEITDEDNRIGNVNNSGTDFVVIKLKFTKSQVQKLFPTLYDVLGTPMEKEWYVGLGNEKSDNKVYESPISTHFVLGFPYENGRFVMNKTKSQGGYIETKNRIVDNDKNGRNNFNSLWIRYNDKENKKNNILNNWWTEYENPFGNPNKHGMKLELLNQMSTIYLDNQDNNALDSGSSGSMMIDSKFNVVGINFKHVEQNGSDNKGNQAVLFKGYSKYNSEEFSGDMKEDLIKILKNKKIKTVKLNSN